MGPIIIRSSSIFLLFLLWFATGQQQQQQQEEEFNEELLIRPLPDRKILSHFHFQTTVPPTHVYGSHHHLFPKAIYQLVNK